MVKTILTAGMVIWTGVACGQPLTRGDMLNEGMRKYLEDGAGKRLFSDKAKKGKMVLLDFWGTGCVSCIKAFPHVDSVQREYGDSVQIVLVNRESGDSTRRFFNRMKRVQRPGVPMISGDSLLNGLFPHLFVPYYAWIDAGGRVVHLSGGAPKEIVTVLRQLAGGNTELRMQEGVKDFNQQVPLIAEGNGRWLGYVKYYSTITDCIPMVSVGNRITDSSISCNCRTINQLLSRAWGEGKPASFERPGYIRWGARDSVRGQFNYQLRTGQRERGLVYGYMQEDMQRYFCIEVRREYRRLTVYVLQGRRKRSMQETEDSSYTNFYNRGESEEIVFRNYPAKEFYDLFAVLYGSAADIAVVNGLQNGERITVSLNRESAENNDVAAMMEGLEKGGLRLVRKKQRREVLVVSGE